MSIIRFFAGHPTAANLFMLLFLVMGLLALPQVNRATFPDLPFDTVQVQVVYPGASPEEVEDAICQRIEDAVDGISNLDEIRCESRENLGQATLEMDSDGVFTQFMDDIQTEVDAIDDFPQDVESPIVSQVGRTDQVTSIAIAGDLSATDLKAYAENVKTRLQRLPEVSQVSVLGFSDRQIRIEIPGDTLRQFGISMADIAQTITQQSVDLPAGTIYAGERDILIRFKDERRTPRDFESLVVVSSEGGAEIRLGEIAKITDRFELDEERMTFNGRNAALLQVTKTRAQDTLDVVDAVAAFVEAENASLPVVEDEDGTKRQTITLTMTQNVASIVRDRLTMLVENGVMGLVLVFLVMWLFFSLRYSFWVAMGLPVSFAGAIFVMSLTGLTFNMLTMVGLLIAIGLLMDDAIVIAENIATQRANGKEPLQAAVDGVRQVGLGVMSSFSTTAFIFLPLAFLEGDIGNILKVMPIILLIVLSVSLVEAFLILPSHLKHVMDKPDKPNRFREAFHERFNSLRDDFAVPLIRRMVENRYLFFGCVLGLMILSFGMVAGGVVKFRAFPELDGNQIDARILMPQGTPLERTEAVIEQVSAALQTVNEKLTPDQPGEQALVQNVLIRRNFNQDSFESGPHVATVSVDLLNSEVRTVSSDEVLARWRAETGPVAGARETTFKRLQIGPAGLPIDLELVGDDLEALKAASVDMQNWLGSFDGVRDLMDDLRPGKPEIRIRLREGASTLGLNAELIARQLRAAFFGITADEIQVGPEAYEIDVRLDLNDRNSRDDLTYFTVTAPSGDQIPLETVAIVEEGQGYSRINRVNRQRTVTVQGDLDFSVTNDGELFALMREEFLPGFEERHPTVKLNVAGQSAETAETGSSLLRAAVIGLFGVFLILSLQFRSFIEPAIVMIIIPLAFIGVVFGHLVMGLDLSMPSMMGFASLSGIVVNNSILLVAFIKMHSSDGFGPIEAAVQAARDRFRPIVLTSLTTIAGLLPLLSETSLQAQVLVPLVTSLAFGLLATLLLVLFVVPATFAILRDFGLSSIDQEHH